MKVNNLSQETIRKIFSLYKEITNRHGNPPSNEEMNEKFSKNLPFEVVSGGFRWSSKLIFKKESNCFSVEFVYNERLPKFMLESLKLMKERFDKEISKTL